MDKTKSPPLGRGTLNTALTFQKTTSIYDKKEYLEQIQENGEGGSQTSLFFLIMAGVLFLGGGSTAFFWLMKKGHLTEWLSASRGKAPLVQQALPPKAKVPHSSPKASPNQQIAVQPIYRKIFINSKPSGAAIFVDGQFLSKYTPSIVSLSAKEVSHITIKKEGYLPKQTVFNPKKQNQNSLSVSLKADPKRRLSSEKIHIIQ